MLRLEYLVHHYVGRVGKIEDRVFFSGRYRNQDVAEVQLLLEEADILPSEHDGYLFGIASAVLREFAHRDGDAGVVPVSFGGYSAGPDHQEAAFHRVFEAGDDMDVIKDLGSVLGSAVCVVPELAGIHEIQLFDIEVRHGPCYGAYVAFEFRSDDDYADFRHVRRNVDLRYFVYDGPAMSPIHFDAHKTLKYECVSTHGMEIPKDHPRYKSLVTRERLAEMVEKGLVTPTGLISHGRGEAYDYLMGEKSTEAALYAEKAAAAFLLGAKNPVVCVNGNAAALDAGNLIKLAECIPAKIEVNLFHRTPERMEGIISYLESKGAKNVLGREPDQRIKGLNHDRALCTGEGIFSSDVIIVPIEDGDRAEALVSMGKTVISIDLNPLSRTSRTASVPISDEMTRALENIIRFIGELSGDSESIERIKKEFSSSDCRRRTVECICDNLMSEFRER
jgi:4-phosphopantoate--beta-alanine ligase